MTTNTAPFTVQPRLTQIAMAAKPTGMIADLVCPRIPVDGEKFVYSKLTTAEMFTIPDARIGRSSDPNQVEFGATDVTDSTEDFALEDFVPQKDIDNARQANNYDPQAIAAEATAMLLDLAREQRVANLFFTKANYNASLATTLNGTGQWSDFTNSDPYQAIMAAFDGMIIRPNVAVLGRLTATKLRSHPKIVAGVAAASNVGVAASAAGKVSLQALADYLELDAIYVGEPFSNTAAKGQTPTYARLWGKHASFLRIDRNIRSVRGMAMPTFAFTAEWNNRFVATAVQTRGIKGGVAIRVGEQVKELIAFQDAGYMFENAVA